MNNMLPYDRRLRDRSRQLRNDMTPAEKYLWSKLRYKQLGYWFYRQKPAGIFITDFYCAHANLIIEVDGSQHFSVDAMDYDQNRTQYFRSLKRRVIRFTNKEVLSNIQTVIDRIKQEIG
jgi:very-short-patch-repair endonuclease